MQRDRVAPPIICIVGSSGAGKTTLLEKLIPELNRRSLRVATVKHDVHGFEMDKPGKDSYRLKHAGAHMSIISSPAKLGMIMDTDHDMDLAELSRFYSGVDIVLAEGYKRENYPKIEVFRKEVHPSPLCLQDSNLVALVTKESIRVDVPTFGPDQIEDLARFVLEEFFGLKRNVEMKS